MLKCYDTLSRQYKEVIVDEALEIELKRSCWREEMSERRYHHRMKKYEEYIPQRHQQDILDTIILNQEIAILRDCIANLPERSQELLYLKYHCDMTDIEIGKKLGISNSYVGRLNKKIKSQIREEMLSKYEYYT